MMKGNMNTEEIAGKVKQLRGKTEGIGRKVEHMRD